MVITRRTLAVVDPRLFGSAVTVNILSIPQQLLERLRQLISAFFHAFSILRQEASCKTCKMGGNSLPCTYHYLVSEFNVCALIPQPAAVKIFVGSSFQRPSDLAQSVRAEQRG